MGSPNEETKIKLVKLAAWLRVKAREQGHEFVPSFAAALLNLRPRFPLCPFSSVKVSRTRAAGCRLSLPGPWLMLLQME